MYRLEYSYSGYSAVFGKSGIFDCAETFRTYAEAKDRADELKPFAFDIRILKMW